LLVTDRFDDAYPETWLDYDAAGNPRVKPRSRAVRARALLVEPGSFPAGA
jgi:hypothetical protein